MKINFFGKIKKKKYKFKSLGENFVWNSGEITDSENICIGNHVYIGPGASIHGRGGIEIKDGVIIGPRVTIHSSNHNYLNAEYLPYDGKTVLRKVEIGENTWIGDSVFICPGVKIGEGVIIGMGSVITKNIEAFSIVGGNPAKIIKIRNDIENYNRLKKEDKIYLKFKRKGEINYSDERKD